MKLFSLLCGSSMLILGSSINLSAQAAPGLPAPDLDLNIQYYSKVLTPEGVTREARYEEKMLRRPGHVWVARVLPKNALEQAVNDAHGQTDQAKKTAGAAPGVATKQAEHKHFNYVVIPRHVVQDNAALRVEYIDAHDKNIVAIPVSEYENVSFDGSWENTFYLLDPKLVKAMPLAKQVSNIPGTVWREREKNGVFQRVLWDEQKQIPLIIESGDKAATFYRRVEVKPLASLSRDLPWQNLKGYAQKEYSDYLD